MTYQLEFKRSGSGFFEIGIAGETLGARKLVYWDGTGTWKLADADAVSRFPVVGITMEAIPSGRTGRIILSPAYIGDADWAWATLGAPIYASTTPGELTLTEPVMGAVIQIVAIVKKTDLILFNTGLNQEIAKFFPNDENWEDLRFPASRGQLGGANPATFQAYKDGAVLAFASNPRQFVYFTGQMSHMWDTGEDIEAHLHWTIPVSGGAAGPENVKWDLTYSWSNIGGAIPNSTPLTVTRDVQDITADTHMLNTFGMISGAGKTKSSMLIMSISRDVGVANDYGQDAYFMEFDLHFNVIRPGSQTIPGNTPA